MAYQALYRKWRPLSFDDVVGQGHIVATLKNESASGKAAHAYLFCGTRGTGKTSCAKIFARAINCLNPKNGNPCNECEICRGALSGSIVDITEIDAASNNGVDNIREIRDEVSYSAAQAKYKIYIIDEVHMLSGGAFNALLKTLEEPPPHVIFILATTEAHKLPATITSRCQRFDFKRISVHDIVVRMREIVTAENINADIEALELIARMADGAMRDALSILDQCAGACGGEITVGKVRSALSVASEEIIDDTVTAISERNVSKIIELFSGVVRDGKDINNYIDLLIRRFRDILVCKVSKNADGLFEYSDDTVGKINEASKLFAPAELSYIIESLCSASADAKWQKNARTLYELVLMRLCDERLVNSNAAILARLEKLEAVVSGGASINVQKVKPAQKNNTGTNESALPDKSGAADDVPPWDEEPAAPPAEKPPAAASKPETVSPSAGTAVSAVAHKGTNKSYGKNVANVWGTLLSTIQGKYPPLYGTLFMKKAKFSNGMLYLVSEPYVKEIINMFKDGFSDVLSDIIGSEARFCFVSESEFDMIDDEVGISSAEGSAAENTPDNKSETVNPENDDSDPLDALLDMGSDDIIVEE